MRQIQPDDLLPFSSFEDEHPIIVDIVYAKPNHPDNIFGQLYPADMPTIWGHKDIVLITLVAANLLRRRHNWTLRIMDCYRATEAQRQMEKFDVHPSLLSKPGIGGHPRGMAIDVEPVDSDGHIIPMGTAFDEFAPDPDNHNPAARNFVDIAPGHQDNREKLETAMVDAAALCDMPLLPLPQEWWDFRFPAEIVKQYTPINENELYDFQRTYPANRRDVNYIKSAAYPENLQRNIDKTHLRARDKLAAAKDLLLK